MKTAYEWKSGFAQVARDYIALKRQTGMKFEQQEWHLRHFDAFYYCHGFEGAVLTKAIAHDFIYDENERPVLHIFIWANISSCLINANNSFSMVFSSIVQELLFFLFSGFVLFTSVAGPACSAFVLTLPRDYHQS